MNWEENNFFSSTDIFSNENSPQWIVGPQALLFDEKIRVFFTKRKLDASGKKLSFVNYIDLDLDLKNIVGRNSSEVISLGAKGTFSEHGIFPFSVIKVEGKFIAYFTGWTRRNSVSVDTGIGVAYGDQNADYFERVFDGPVIQASPNEPFLICDANVHQISDKFYMFYIFGTSWICNQDGIPERSYKIGVACSADGLNWTKPFDGKQIISGSSEEAQAMPAIVEIEDGFYLMVFAYRSRFGFRENISDSYKLGAAVSRNLMDWERKDSLVSFELPFWARKMQCYPNVIKVADRIVLFFNGDNFGQDGFGVYSISIEEVIANAKL